MLLPFDLLECEAVLGLSEDGVPGPTEHVHHRVIRLLQHPAGVGRRKREELGCGGGG